MGVINLTPVSMSGSNPILSQSEIHHEVVKMVNEGAEIIDVGAESTRPEALPLAPEEEWQRLIPFVDNLNRILEDSRLPIKPQISIDTYHAETVRKLMEYDIDIINDVFGIERKAIAELLKGTGKKYILVHNMGRAGTKYMKEDQGVVDQMVQWFFDRTEELLKQGLNKSQIILDPGIGFGKTPEQTAAILQNIDRIKSMGFPVVIGHSRKASALPAVKHLAPIERDLETACLSKKLSCQKVDIIRVHNCRLNRNLMDAKISILVAHQNDRGIGYQNQLPWELKADKQHFRKLTLGHTIIMGRRTFESIGRPLDKRRNIVISTTLSSAPEEVEIYSSLQEALEHIHTNEEIFIIGGERLYKEALPFADYLFQTVVDASEPVDRYFPKLNEENWILENEESVASDEFNQFPQSIKSFKRVRPVAGV